MGRVFDIAGLGGKYGSIRIEAGMAAQCGAANDGGHYQEGVGLYGEAQGNNDGSAHCRNTPVGAGDEAQAAHSPEGQHGIHLRIHIGLDEMNYISRHADGGHGTFNIEGSDDDG